MNPLMSWMDSPGISYLAWAWNAGFNCSSGPGLISNYNSTATAYGAGVESRLQSLAGAIRDRLPCHGGLGSRRE